MPKILGCSKIIHAPLTGKHRKAEAGKCCMCKHDFTCCHDDAFSDSLFPFCMAPSSPASVWCLTLFCPSDDPPPARWGDCSHRCIGRIHHQGKLGGYGQGLFVRVSLSLSDDELLASTSLEWTSVDHLAMFGSLCHHSSLITHHSPLITDR